MKKLILLINLGSPAECTARSIRVFLRQFLSDKRVVQLSRFIWYPILYGIILPFRGRKLVHQYKKIWINNCSPLIHHTRECAQSFQEKVNNTAVDYAFCYGTETVAEKLSQYQDITDLVVLPLYPQFSSTTTSAAFDQIAKFYQDKFYLPKINFISDFHDNDAYTSAIADSLRAHLDSFILFSYHGLPQAVIDQGDPYMIQCIKTSKLIAEKLSLNKQDYKVSFQSKFGRAKWIGPATNDILIELAKAGKKSVTVICPGFICDCLETLEEIKIESGKSFIKHGGEHFTYVPCLNSVNCLDSRLRGNDT